MSIVLTLVGFAAFFLLCFAYANWCDRQIVGRSSARRQHPAGYRRDGNDEYRTRPGDVWARHFWIGPATEGRLTPSLPSALAFLLAIWLGFAPFVLQYYVPARGGAGPASDMAVAVVVGFLAFARLVAPRDFPWLSLVIAGLGGWLIVAPLVLHYASAGGAPAEVGNDEVVGALLLLLGAASALMTYRQRTAERALSETARNPVGARAKTPRR